LPESSEGLFSKLQESIEIIPVHCFDSRELEFYPAYTNPFDFLNSHKDEVQRLQNNLLKKGNNLLIVYDYFEKIIPSLARVLHVSAVVTDEIPVDSHTLQSDLTHFRNSKALEVQKLLNMHSIPVYFWKEGADLTNFPLSIIANPKLEQGDILSGSLP